MVAIGAFFLTRAIAANNRDMRVRDAAEWYRRGRQQLDNGNSEGAIESLRRATLRNDGNRQYVLTLAEALAQAQQFDAARRELLALRDAAPDDVTVNLQLARLAAARDDVAEATRFYRSALYAPWASDETGRREVRFELVHLLMTHGQRDRAESELLAASADVPDDAVAHVRIGQLFAAAGDRSRALDQFQRALRIDPNNGAALAGAGQTAFSLGDYAAARKFLQRAPPDIGDVSQTREVVALMAAIDPLESRIGPAARKQRLADTLAYADQRVTACLDAPGDRADAEALRQAARGFSDRLAPSRRLEADTIEEGLELADRIEERVTRRCAPTPHDRAAILVARLHGVEAR